MFMFTFPLTLTPVSHFFNSCSWLQLLLLYPLLLPCTRQLYPLIPLSNDVIPASNSSSAAISQTALVSNHCPVSPLLSLSLSLSLPYNIHRSETTVVHHLTL